MNSVLKNDLNTLPKLLDDIKKLGVDFLNNLDNLPTFAADQKVDSFSLPEQGLGTRESLELFKENYLKLFVASGGPRYWGFVTGGATPAAIAGDWLTSVFDQNTQGVKGAGDVSAIIEIEAIRLMRELFGLPDSFNGGFVTGATMSNFTCAAFVNYRTEKKTSKSRSKNYSLLAMRFWRLSDYCRKTKNASGKGSILHDTKVCVISQQCVLMFLVMGQISHLHFLACVPPWCGS